MRDPEPPGWGRWSPAAPPASAWPPPASRRPRRRVACLDLAPAPLEARGAGPRRCKDDAAVRAAVGEAAQRLGGLDIVVNNAGVGAAGTIEANLDHDWHQVWTSTSSASSG